MAQRNPMNQRYQGDGPGGQTKKSASSAKPSSAAASSVHIRSKPTTNSEKRAAAKAREREAQKKAAEKARKAELKAQSSAGESGTPVSAPAVKKESNSVMGKAKGFFDKLLAPAPNMPTSPEYKKWRKLYWILIVGGIVSVALSWILQMLFVNLSVLWIATMVLAYAFIGAAFFIDFRKVRPLIREHQTLNVGNKSPKRIKHEQEAAEHAAQLEAARKVAKEASRKQLFPRRKASSDLTPGEQGEAVKAPGQED
jgi:hypothetical protein